GSGGAIAADPARVGATCADRAEGAGRRGGLARDVVAPAGDGAVTADRTGVVETRADHHPARPSTDYGLTIPRPRGRRGRRAPTEDKHRQTEHHQHAGDYHAEQGDPGHRTCGLASPLHGVLRPCPCERATRGTCGAELSLFDQPTGVRSGSYPAPWGAPRALIRRLGGRLGEGVEE